MIQQIPEYDAREMYEDEMAELAPEERIDFLEWLRDNQIETV